MLIIFLNQIVVSSHLGLLDLHQEFSFDGELLYEELLDNFIGIFWSINTKSDLRYTTGITLAWAHSSVLRVPPL